MKTKTFTTIEEAAKHMNDYFAVNHYGWTHVLSSSGDNFWATNNDKYGTHSIYITDDFEKGMEFAWMAFPKLKKISFYKDKIGFKFLNGPKFFFTLINDRAFTLACALYGLCTGERIEVKEGA